MKPTASSSPSPAFEPQPTRTLIQNPDKIIERLHQLYALTGDKILLDLIKQHKSGNLSLDLINNSLMAVFRDHALVDAYSMLYELNHRQFLLVIFNKIKYYCHILDPKDILQDVFLSIYRYPHRFREEKEHAFRNWTYSIIRNTVLKHLKMRNSQESSSDKILEIIEDQKEVGPLNRLVKRESIKGFKKLYLFYLILYLNIVNNYLSEREKLALQLVEVEDKRYREASQVLGIKLENFKMIVCRARKKILKQMIKMLGED